MLVKTLLKKCETGFDLIVVADSATGHTMEYRSVADALIEAGGNKIISWEVGFSVVTGYNFYHRKFILLVTI